MRRGLAGPLGLCAVVFVSVRAQAAPDQVLMTPPPAGQPPPPAPGAGASLPPAAVVTSPAASAPAGAPVPPAPTIAGWIPGTGFVLQSDDGAFRLRIGLQAAYKFEPVYQSGWQDRNMFFVLRPILAGNFFKEWIRFLTSFELASNPPFLVDSYVELMPWKEFGLRVGQQLTPFDRHIFRGPMEILFPEWSSVSEYLSTGRDKGLTAMGAAIDGKLEYWAGLYSGTPLRQYNALPGNYMVEGRVTWSPLGSVANVEFPYIVSDGPTPFRVSLSAQGYYGRIQTALENFDPSTFTFQTVPTGDTRTLGAGGADFWVYNQYFSFYLEGIVRRTEPPMAAPAYTSGGLWAQLGVPVVARTMDVATRFNWLNPTNTLGNDNFYSIEGMLGYYAMHTPNLVVKLRYALGHQSSPDPALLGPVRLVLTAPGWIQLGTIQLNLAF